MSAMPTSIQRISRFCCSLSLVSLLSIFACTQVTAANVAGIDLKASVKLGNKQLHLNGAGQRSKYFIDLYVAALYLQNKSIDAQAIIDADEMMLIQLHVISNLITSENLTRGTQEGFDKATKHNTRGIQEQIDEFLLAFKEPIKVGDVFEIVYLPGDGVSVIKNRKLTKRLTADLAFKRALFGIWLSDNPAQKTLKVRLLGK